MKKDEIRKALGECVKEGSMEVRIDLDDPKKEPSFSFTEEGRKEMEHKLRSNPETQSFMFQLMWNGLLQSIDEGVSTVEAVLLTLDTAKDWEEMTNIKLHSLVEKIDIANQVGFDVKGHKRKAFANGRGVVS